MEEMKYQRVWQGKAQEGRNTSKQRWKLSQEQGTQRLEIKNKVELKPVVRLG